MNQNYPKHIIVVLRQWEGLEEDDDSRDDEFQSMSPYEVYEAVLEWEGIYGYAEYILQLIQSVFKVDVVEVSRKTGGEH